MSGKGGHGDASGDDVFTCGKHKGVSFREVAGKDAQYSDWAMKLENPRGCLQDFVRFLRSTGKTVKIPPPDKAASDLVLVCQAAGDEFLVFPEMPNAKGNWIPRHLWTAIGSLPGACLSLDRKSWIFPMQSYQSILSELRKLGSVEGIPSWVRSLLEKAKHQRGHEVQETRLPAGLMEYQLEGVSDGMRREGRILLADEMGLGKTLQALSLAAQYREEWPVLVVCPSSLRWVWQEQAQTWLSDLQPSDVQVIEKGSQNLSTDAKMFIISYHLMAGANKEKFQLRPDGKPHRMIIADESHCIKDWSTMRTQTLVPLLQKASRAILLSGTPTRNTPEELHPQLCGVLPGFHVTMAEFRSRYCVMQLQNCRGLQVSRCVGARCASELNMLLSSTVMTRRLKSEVCKQLPDKRRRRVPLHGTGKLMKEIASKSEDLMEDEVAGNFFYKIAQAKLPAVKEYISELLDRVDEKVLIFAHHKFVMDDISAILTKHLKAGFVRIDGSVAASQRPVLVKRFQEEASCRVALVSITAGGEGLTMSAASLVVFAELYWVPGAIEQAEARAHRIGSTHSKIVVEFLVLPSSADEKIYGTLQQKKMVTSQVVDGVSETLNAPTHIPNTQKRTVFQTSEATKRAAEPAEVTPKRARSMRSPVKHSSEEHEETPPPVDRSKVEALLQAIAKGREQFEGTT